MVTFLEIVSTLLIQTGVEYAVLKWPEDSFQYNIIDDAFRVIKILDLGF